MSWLAGGNRVHVLVESMPLKPKSSPSPHAVPGTLKLKPNPKLNHLCGRQNYGPFLGPYYNTAPII